MVDWVLININQDKKKGYKMKILITGGLGRVVSGLLPRLSKCYDLRLSHWRVPEEPMRKSQIVTFTQSGQ